METILELKSYDGCQLSIGSYPTFKYNATGGGGKSFLYYDKETDLRILDFDLKTFNMPNLNTKTTKLLGLPIPPGIEVNLFLNSLKGTINYQTREVLLNLNASFILKLFKTSFPPLEIKTVLTTKTIQGEVLQGNGSNWLENGDLTLVGISKVYPTSSKILNIFLGLPNEALAVLRCNLR